MKSVINSYELSLYFVVWISTNVYALYKLFVFQTGRIGSLSYNINYTFIDICHL